MKMFYKYRKVNSQLFLLAYLFLFLIGIHHSHNIIWNNKSINVSHTDNKGMHHDPFSTDDSFCLLAHLNSSLLNNSLFSPDYSTCFFEVTKVTTTDHFINSFLNFSSIALRAPPSSNKSV